MESILPRKIEKLLQSIEVLVIDDNPYMRKVIRNLLTSIGVKNVHEAVDGVAGLEAIRMLAPSLVILDWECRCSPAPSWCGSSARPACSRCPTFPLSC